MAKHLTEFIHFKLHSVLVKDDQLTALETKLLGRISLLEKLCLPNVTLATQNEGEGMEVYWC